MRHAHPCINANQALHENLLNICSGLWRIANRMKQVQMVKEVVSSFGLASNASRVEDSRQECDHEGISLEAIMQLQYCTKVYYVKHVHVVKSRPSDATFIKV